MMVTVPAALADTVSGTGTAKGFGGASVKRIHRPLNDEGKVVSVGTYMVPRLEAACVDNGSITFLMETTANTILTRDGAACGIVATGKGGETVTVNARAVILATGGFGANRLGGNAVADIMVFGRIAGAAAAEYAK